MIELGGYADFGKLFLNQILKTFFAKMAQISQGISS